MTLKRTMCALLAATMLLPTAIMAETSAAAAEVDVAESAAQLTEESSETGSYGLRDNIQDGVILHCFDWTYNDIKAELPNIAKAGFTSVQTSPAQQACGTGAWYWAYQPLGFYIGNTFGTKAELQSLCEEAHKYGIKVIVDSIGNHLASDHTYIQDDLKDSQYYHNSGYSTSLNNVDWTNRWQVTHCDVGMPDLATENSHVQQCAKKYMEELKSVGVDGIRWDTAKHIELPSEGDNFWPTVSSVGLYQYGEILKGPDDRDSGNEALMKEYTNYMSVTDSEYGSTVRNAFASGNVPGAYGNWVARGITSDKMVYWGESHDTWANAYEGDYSWNKSENVIDRAYAAVASRNQATALYYSRPLSNPEAKENTKIGEKGSTHFTSKEVAAVNHFHNAMVGKADYYTASNGCAVITRKDGGAIVVKGSGSGYVSVTNGGGYAKTGTYKDEITGNEFTVTSTTITGTIGDSGIAVIYDAQDSGSVSATPSSGTTFTKSISVTLNAKDVKNTTYKTSDGASGEFSDGQVITIGSSIAEGSTVTLTLTGTKSDGSTATAAYTYTKTAPKTYPHLDGAGFVFDNSTTKWSSVNAYVYDESGSSVITNGAWPGVKMTDCGDGYWKYNLDSKFSGSNIRVIFNNGSDQIPASQQPGYQMSSSDKKLYEGGNWKDLPVPSITVSLSASPTKVTVGEPVTLTANATGASGTVNYTFSDGSNTIQSSTNNTAAWTPVAEGEYKVTVTAKDSKNATATATANVSVIKIDSDSDSDSDTDIVELKNTSKVSSTSVTTGTTVTITGSATGGTKPYKYAFYYRRSADSKWTLKGTEYGTATSTTLTPGYVDTYYVLVNVMDSDGNIVPKTFTINVSKKETLTNNSTFSATTVKAGTAVTAKASASGGTSPYTYAYYWKKSTSSTWTTKKAYSTTTSVSYSFSIPGDYDLKVAVKDSTGTIVEKESPLTVTTVNPLTNSSTISATTVTPGTSFKVTGKATGGTSPYTYAYYYKKSTASSWTTKKAYSSTASATYTINTAGTYDVKVSVKDNDGNVADKTFSVIVGQAELENNSTLSSTVVKPGTSITATASAAGGTGSYTYAFWWQKMGGSGWNTKKAYSTSKTAAYTFNTAGAYNVRISVKDSSGKIKSVTYHVYITTLTNSSTLSATSVSKGTAIKATGKSSNGSGTKQYAFYWKKSTSSTWTTKSAYGVAATATYTFNTAGTYDIRISVKDSTDAVVFKDYTVTVK